MSKPVPESLKVSPFIVLFLVHSIQVGVGILTFQSTIIEYAGYDAWISILIAGILNLLVIWTMFRLLSQEEKDIFAIHKKIMGKWIGGFISLIFVGYYLFMAIIVLRLYIEVIQVWMFPKISVFYLGLVFLTLVYYVVSGGFRVVAGICFLGVVIPLYLVLTLIFPLEFAHFDNLFPILNHSPMEIVLSAKEMTLSYLGISTLLVYFPFIKHPKKARKWAYLGIVLTIFMYLLTAIVTFSFYDEEQIKTVIWPTLGLWKIIEMPFVERFEYIGISSWSLVILPNIALTVWAASRGMKRVLGLNQRRVVVFFLLIALIALVLVNGHGRINILGEYMTTTGLIISFLYVPLLYIANTIYNKVRKSR